MEMQASGEQRVIENELTHTVITSTVGTLTAGSVTWLLRASSLIAGMFCSIPLWTNVDPLPVLSMTDRQRRRRLREQEAARGEDAADRNLGRLLGESKDTGNGSAPP